MRLIVKSRMPQMEDRSESLQVKCDSLERSVAILVKEQKGEYSAPDIPRSHWIEATGGFDNDDEEYIAGMEKFLVEVKSAVHELRGDDHYRLGWCDAFITDGRAVNLGGNYHGERVLLHDDVLQPHWKEFANALQLYQTSNNSEIDELGLYYIQLAPSVLGLLSPALKGGNIKYFTLENNDFANVREGIEFAVDAIRGIRQMKKLSWDNNRINNMEDA